MLIQIQEPGQSELPHQKIAAIGIDLGTTNSLVAIADNGNLEVIEDAEGALLPSVVAYGEGKAIVGRQAKEKISEKKYTVISSIKRLMGMGYEDLKNIAGISQYKIEQGEGIVRLNIGKKKITPIEVSAEILKALKFRAENALGQAVTKAVITVPAHFDEGARLATKDAAKLAGLEVLRLINEPTAAALAYGLDKAAEGIYAIYDLGGGTFDFSLLKMENGVFQVLSTAGDMALGGDDFDHEIVKILLKIIGKSEANTSLINTLLLKARKIKEYLSIYEKGKFDFEIEGKKYSLEFTRTELEKLIAPYIARSIKICAEAVRDSKINKSDIKGVVLVGGSTRIPLVKAFLKEEFNIEPLDDVDPDKVVAFGAAIQAEALTRGSDNLLLDVTPLSLGLEIMGGITERLIERNSPIPIAVSQEFTTYQDGQTAMNIHVVQGEREMAKDCRSLANFNLTGIPPMKAGIPHVKVTFTLDADGLLNVSAKETNTGVEQKIEVKPSYGLEDAEIEEMLRASMENAKADIKLKLLTESRVEADLAVKVVEDAIRMDAELLEKAEKKKIDGQLKHLKEVIKKEDRDLIDAEVAFLNKLCANFAEKRMNRSIAKALQGKEINALTKKLS